MMQRCKLLLYVLLFHANFGVCNSSYTKLSNDNNHQFFHLDSILKLLESQENVDSVDLEITTDSVFRFVYSETGKETIDRLDRIIQLAFDNRVNGTLTYAYHLKGYVLRKLGELDRAIEIFEKELEIALQINDELKISHAYGNIGNVYEDKGDLLNTFKYYSLALKHAPLANKDTPHARALINMGALYYKLGNLEQSLMYYLEALELSQLNNYTGYYASIYIALGNIHKQERDFSGAKTYYQKALAISRKVNNSGKIIASLCALGALSHEEKQYSNALECYTQALDFSINKAFPIEEGFVRIQIALVLIDQNKLSEATKELNSGIDLFEKNEVSSELYKARIGLGKLLNSKGEFSQAKSVLLDARTSAVQSKDLESQMKASFELSKSYQGLNQFEQSLGEFVYGTSLQDSLLNKAKIRELTRSEIGFTYERIRTRDSVLAAGEKVQIDLKHEKELRAHQRSFYQIIIIGGLFLLLAAGALLVLISKRKQERLLKVKNKRIQEANNRLTKTIKEKELLMQEVHHRIKNNLGMISSFLQLKSMSLADDKARDILREGRDQVYSFALAHEKMYKTENYEQMNLVEYCREIFQSLTIREQRRCDTCLFELLGPDIFVNVEKVQVIGFVLHELVQNSFKHAWKRDDNKQIKVEFKLDKNEVQIIYFDNGIGLQSDQAFDAYDSLGLKLIHSFVVQNLGGKIIRLDNDHFHLQINFAKQ